MYGIHGKEYLGFSVTGLRLSMHSPKRLEDKEFAA
jgi:hypothetical protein